MFRGFFVRRELNGYRRKGPRKTTRMLLDAVKAQGIEGATLLDIGGGVGVIQHELLRAGAGRATGVDAAPAYIEAAREEARRQGYSDRVEQRHGDFVELAGELEPADVVTLDRVICCYPDVKGLVKLSADRARRIYAVVYPRDTRLTRIGGTVLNFFLWLRRNPFRVFMHPTREVEALIQGAGLRQTYHRKTLYWQVAVYTR